jgi:hypothetical protein
MNLCSQCPEPIRCIENQTCQKFNQTPPPNYNVRNEEIEAKLKEWGNRIGQSLKSDMPRGWGFTLLMYSYGTNPKGGMFYISSAEREDMIKAMEEFIKLNKH